MLKRKIKNLRLSHIAAVDRPCQAGAVVAIIKRDDSDPAARFESKVCEIQKRAGCPMHVAMSRARVEHPDLFVAFQTASKNIQLENREPDPTEVASAKAQGNFMQLAREIADRDEVPLNVGMSRARVAAPALFEAWV